MNTTKSIVKTGYGYIKETATGRIICKYELRPGEHPLKEGYTRHEVKDKKALENIKVYKEPKVRTKDKWLAMLDKTEIRAKKKEIINE